MYSGNATLSPLPLIESHEPSRAINPAQSAYPPDDDLTRLQVIAQCEYSGETIAGTRQLMINTPGVQECDEGGPCNQRRTPDPPEYSQSCLSLLVRANTLPQIQLLMAFLPVLELSEGEPSPRHSSSTDSRQSARRSRSSKRGSVGTVTAQDPPQGQEPRGDPPSCHTSSQQHQAQHLPPCSQALTSSQGH